VPPGASSTNHRQLKEVPDSTGKGIIGLKAGWVRETELSERNSRERRASPIPPMSEIGFANYSMKTNLGGRSSMSSALVRPVLISFDE
jgi:hypothetical protein